jgi:hypothetical protein
MRSDIQEIFKMTPHDKQVMMFSATLSPEIRIVCKKFMSNVRAKSPSGVLLPELSHARREGGLCFSDQSGSSGGVLSSVPASRYCSSSRSSRSPAACPVQLLLPAGTQQRS